VWKIVTSLPDFSVENKLSMPVLPQVSIAYQQISESPISQTILAFYQPPIINTQHQKLLAKVIVRAFFSLNSMAAFVFLYRVLAISEFVCYMRIAVWKK